MSGYEPSPKQSTLKELGTSRLLNVLVWLCIIPVFIGGIFKVMHWPGASVLVMFSFFVLLFLYIPTWLVLIWPPKGRARLIRFLQALILFVLALGTLFRFMHWPGAGFFSFIFFFIFCFVLIPYFLYLIGKYGRESIQKLNSFFLLVFFTGMGFVGLMTSSSNKVNVDSVLQHGINQEYSLNAGNARNEQFYKVMERSDSGSVLVSAKTMRLKSNVDKVYQLVNRIKLNLIRTIDGIEPSEIDSFSCTKIINKLDYDRSTFLLIGRDMFNVSTDSVSANFLKKEINKLKDTLIELVQEPNRGLFRKGMGLYTDTYDGEDGEIYSWEVGNFFHMPLVHSFITLTGIQYELRNAEYQVMIDIANDPSIKNDDRLQKRIREENLKTSQANASQELQELKSRNEQGFELLNRKQSELQDTQQSITYFVLAILAFIVLIFFSVRNSYLRKQANKQLAEQKGIVEEKQREILDSISYAKRIQNAILPPEHYISQYLKEFFILYQPKDIVAGDFYWMENTPDGIFMAAADSTGHGVPGAMVSVVCSNALNRSVKEFGLKDPGQILDKTRELVLETFSKSSDAVRDGMDISLIFIDKANRKISWSGANNALWYVTEENGEYKLKEIKPDKQPIGLVDDPGPFTTHVLPYPPNSVFYLFTDGYPDQFGGANGKKFKYKQLSALMESIASKPLQEQKTILSHTLSNWMGELEQVDDITVIGIKI